MNILDPALPVVTSLLPTDKCYFGRADETDAVATVETVRADIAAELGGILPTTDPEVVGRLWIDSGAVVVSAGPVAPSDDFSIVLDDSSVSVDQSGTVEIEVTTAVLSGSAQTIVLTATGLPSGVTGVFVPSTIEAGEVSTLTLSATAGATPVVADAFSIVATGETQTHSADATVTVVAVGTNDFTVDLDDSSVSVIQGGTVDIAVTITLTSGDAETVALTVTGLPAGVTGVFAPSSVTSGGGESVLTLTATGSAALVTDDAFSVVATGSVVNNASATVSVLDVMAALTGALQTSSAVGNNTPLYLFQDQAGTVPAVTAGQPVSSARHAVTGVSVAQFYNGGASYQKTDLPTLQFVNSVPVVRFVAAKSHLAIAQGGSFAGRYQWIRFLERAPGVENAGLVSDMTSATGLDQTNPNTSAMLIDDTELPTNFLNRDCPSVLTTRCIHHNGSGGISQAVETAALESATGAATGVSDLKYIGCRFLNFLGGPSQFNNIDLQGIWWGTGLTTAQVTAIDARLSPRTTARRVVCVGDSLTRGQYLTIGTPQISQTYPDQLQVLNPTNLVINWGNWGEQIASTIARQATINAAFRAAGDVLVLCIGSNDLAIGTHTAASLRTQLIALVDAFQLVGWYVIVDTITVRTDAGVTSGIFEAQRAAFNSALAADHAFADGFHDRAAIAHLSDSTNATYFFDLCHYTAAGCADVAAGVSAVLP